MSSDVFYKTSVSLTIVFIKKDLGILLTSNLDYHLHILHVTCKSLKTLGIIKCISMDCKLHVPYSLEGFYCAFIKSTDEYG